VSISTAPPTSGCASRFGRGRGKGDTSDPAGGLFPSAAHGTQGRPWSSPRECAS
jgi:hypothetical protein